MTLGEIIKQYRSEHGYSMLEFANRCGISKQYVSFLEKNMNPKNGNPISPSVDTIKKVAAGMGVSANAIFNQLDADIVIRWKKEDPIPFTDHELSMILKYRILDDLGQKTVDAVLDLQYERVRK